MEKWTLSKTPPKPSTLESPKTPSKLSSAIPNEPSLAEPLKSPKNPHTPQLFRETVFFRTQFYERSNKILGNRE